MLASSSLRKGLFLHHALRTGRTVAITARRSYEANGSQEEGGRLQGQTRRKESTFKSLCKLTLIGRTGAVAETRNFDDGSSVLCLSVATTHASGSRADAKQDTQWHNVYVSQSTPGYSFFEQLPAGSHVYVEGLMRIRTVEREGEKRQFVNVNVSQGFGMIRVLSVPRSAEVRGDGAVRVLDKKLPF